MILKKFKEETRVCGLGKGEISQSPKPKGAIHYTWTWVMFQLGLADNGN